MASSKSGCRSATDEAQGAINSRWPWGLERGPGPGEVQQLLIRDQRNGDG